jgi:ABC-2 type transport system ATP-binding protein
MRRLAVPVTALALVGAALLTPSLTSASAVEPEVTVQSLHFKVMVGPALDKECDVVGDVYLPDEATPATPVPAILTTNGFGGSKDDQAGLGQAMARRGYVVLSYSGLGFGGSSCAITLDDPDWDGQAGRQLISYLGGASGIAFQDAEHTVPAPTLDVVQKDPGTLLAPSPHDPRVGMVGGSYGGAIQFAVASVDPRLDTIVPLITWNDLRYSLNPNNTAITSGVSSSTPGAIKMLWGLGFSLVGLTGDAQQGDLVPDLACPNFAWWVCPALATAGSTGYFQPAHAAAAYHASVASYIKKVKIPTLLIQGENDTLFNLNEAIATYKALKAQHTPVKMIWQSWGHSGGAAPGEINLGNPDPAAQYETGRIFAWFEHYLKDADVDLGPNFSYFRPWISYAGNAAPAYASAPSYPVGANRTFRFSGQGQLVNSLATQPGAQTFVTPPLGAPTSLNTFDVLGSYVGQPVNEIVDAPGTFARWTTPVLTSKLDVVGMPVLSFRIKAPTAIPSSVPAKQLVLFVKLADVGPDGKARMIKGLEAPIRIPDARNTIKVNLPAIVHRFEPGHRLRLIVAGGSVNYRGGLEAVAVRIESGSGQTLSLPVVN